jgi:hypothetical protein
MRWDRDRVARSWQGLERLSGLTVGTRERTTSRIAHLDRFSKIRVSSPCSTNGWLAASRVAG